MTSNSVTRQLDFDYPSTRINPTEIDNADSLPKEDGWIQEAGCVLKGPYPFFFMIRFLHEYGSTPLFLEIEEIYCDEYLDFILEDKILIDLT